jgi:hypothetical protein
VPKSAGSVHPSFVLLMLKEIRFFEKIGFLGRNKNGVKNKPQKRFKFNTLGHTLMNNLGV